MQRRTSWSKLGILFLGLYLTSTGITSLGFNVTSLSGVTERQHFLKESLLLGASENVTGFLLLLTSYTVFVMSAPTDTIPKSTTAWSGSTNPTSMGIPSPVTVTSIV